MSNPKIGIIGAGPGGLASAILLASHGCRVTVFDRLPVVGGRTSAHGEKGFRFDLGPTFFLYPSVLEAIFETAGRDLMNEIPMVRLDPQYRILFGKGGKLDATPDVERMEAEIRGIAPGDAAQFSRFLEDNRRKLLAFRPVLEQPFCGLPDYLRPELFASLPFLNPHLSVDGYLRSFFKDERVRLAFSFQSKYLGMSPFRCPSLFSILSFLEYEHGVWHPMGGCAAVSEGMARVAQEMGVEIRLGEAVEQLEFDNGGHRVTGVHTRSGMHPFDAVVLNADFARAMTRLFPDHLRKRWNNERIKKSKFSCSTFMMYLGIEGRYPLPHHSIYIAEDYRGNLRDIEQDHQLSEDTSFYVQNACVTDPGLAPEGHSTLYVLAPVTQQHPNVDWRRETALMRGRLLKQISKAGYEGIENRIVYERIVTPQDWDTGYEIHLGATFNLAHSLDQMLHLRPHNRFEDLDGVYLVGGGTHPGSGLPVIYESARISSKLLLEDLGMTVRGADRCRAANGVRDGSAFSVTP